jgi:hypothetical protein
MDPYSWGAVTKKRKTSPNSEASPGRMMARSGCEGDVGSFSLLGNGRETGERATKRESLNFKCSKENRKIGKRTAPLHCYVLACSAQRGDRGRKSISTAQSIISRLSAGRDEDYSLIAGLLARFG